MDNLVAAAFENVRNVEEGIDVLWATYQYAKRPNLKDLFEKKTYHVRFYRSKFSFCFPTKLNQQIFYLNIVYF